ncbi:LysM peptidoglycan-binding domain-containing protein [Argonema galeatum]|uniref:LysM peptidoglycan-binding domain-containing protein n=1 Tax=Argonema galeatum TaxID=2942762 RepID=UPI00201190C6|nr:LysM domain-containing protein [Argonema galeatum]MCL1466856.1 LysM peptidoglycan-binding domain-containing protein [Argonema galeatum A003/A1]
MPRKQGNPPCEHTVESGDTFSILAGVYYGDPSDANANKIMAANPGVAATSLSIGQKINIPA